MKRIVLAGLATFLWTALFAANTVSDRGSLVTHEWGTFTSVASEDGTAVKWSSIANDLPCFVKRLVPGLSPKSQPGSASTIRMETPVLYFYSPLAAKISVKVGFPQGLVTEWYPRASKVNAPGFGNSSYRDGHIAWDEVEVLPLATPELPVSRSANHYFAARETKASPVRVGEQWEKMLFYRGVGDFEVPLQPVFTKEGKLRIRNMTSQVVPVAMLFENRSGKLYVRTGRGLGAVAELDAPQPVGLEEVQRDLVGHLTEAGLYREEAQAMVATWRSSWFEEGARLFYVLPRPLVDTILPLQITPAPASIERVFVGRIELVSETVRKTISTAVLAHDDKPLLQFGRFLEPFVSQVERTGREMMWTPFTSKVAGRIAQQRYRGPYCVQ